MRYRDLVQVASDPKYFQSWQIQVTEFGYWKDAKGAERMQFFFLRFLP